MPKPLKKEVTFVGWIEDILKLPISFPKQTLGLYFDSKRRQLNLIEVESSGANVPESVFISSFEEGAESFRDIKGISTAMTIEDLAKHPLKVLNGIGKNLIEEIRSIDEVTQDVRAEKLENLTKGSTIRDLYTKDLKETQDISEPENAALKIARALRIPLVDSSSLIDPVTGKSKIQLVGSPKFESKSQLTDSEKNEDRKTLEDKGDPKQFSSYKDLAAALTGMAGYSETSRNRTQYRDQANLAYNRSLLRELGVDLDKALPTKTGKVAGVKVRDATGALIYKVDPGTKKEILVSEEAPGTFKKTFIDLGETRPARERLDEILNNNSLIEKSLGMTAGSLSTWDPLELEFLKATLKAEFLTNSFDGFNPRDRKKKKMDMSKRFNEQTRVTLQAQLLSEINKPKIQARIRENIRKQAIEEELKRLNAKYPQRTFRTEADLDPVSKKNVDDATLHLTQMASDRVEDATNALKVANNLFFASTVKEVLEQVEQGSFIKAALINTRLLGTLPFISDNFGSGSDLASVFDTPFIKLNNFREKYHLRTEDFAMAAGLSFKGDASELKGLSKLTKIENRVSVEWAKTFNEGTPDEYRIWHEANIKSKDLAGLFGEDREGSWGIHNTLKRSWQGNGKRLIDAGIPGVVALDPKNLLQDETRLVNYLEQLHQGAIDLRTQGQAIIPQGYQLLAYNLGLDDDLSFSEFEKQLRLFNDPQHGGRRLLFDPNSPLNIIGDFDPDKRWEFLERIIKQNKLAELQKAFMGPLQYYNRWANRVRSFAYKQILWGGYSGNNFLIKSLIKLSTPIRALLHTIGFSDEELLAQAISKWSFVKGITKYGKNLMKFGGGEALPAGRLFGKAIIARLMQSATGKAILQSLGYLLSGIGGSLTGGIGWIIAGFGDIGWAFLKNALRLNFGKALADAKATTKAKWDVIKKVFIYPIGACCSCIFGVMFFIIIFYQIVLTDFVGGGGAYEDVVVSDKVSVKKTATLSGNEITFTVTIKNITTDSNQIEDQPITISSIDDNLSFTLPCDASGAPTGTINIDGNTEYGNFVKPTLEDFSDGGLTLAPGETKTKTFKLTNVTTQDGTYTNTIDVKIAEDAAERGTASATFDIGEGGCFKCPSGWPTRPFSITQGPEGSFSHTNAEAVDMVADLGKPVIATHNGTATAFKNTCDDSNHALICGYGNHVEINSGQNFKTIYAHLSGFNIPFGKSVSVNKGDVIGYVGTSGNSTGNHLHYEFKSASYECIAQHPLKLEQVEVESYVPISIPRNCAGFSECGNFSVE